MKCKKPKRIYCISCDRFKPMKGAKLIKEFTDGRKDNYWLCKKCYHENG